MDELPVIGFDTKDCQINNIIVYPDRAEVSRSKKITASALGECEVKISNVTYCADPDSIRVKGVGHCQILEVTHDVVVDNVNNDTSSSSKGLAANVTSLRKKKHLIKMSLSRKESQKKLTESYSEGILSAPKASPSVSFSRVEQPPSNSPLALGEAMKVLSFYSEEVAKLDLEIFELKEQLSMVDEELAIASDLLRQNTNLNSSVRIVKTRDVSIVVDIKSLEEPISLFFSYVVSNATWSPSYDIRFSTVDNSLSLYYFAEVTQKSGEDWTDGTMSLSTSNPAIGSSPPPLPTKRVEFKSHYCSYNSRGGGGLNAALKRYNSDDEGSLSDADSCSLLEEDDNHRRGATSAYRMQPASSYTTAGINGSGEAGSTTFQIQRKVNIASDNKPHKVTVTVESFTPKMIHYVAPSVSANVYLQAKTQNTSAYPLLASDKVSVFLDGNFVSTSAIKQAGSQEYFTLYLGVDPSVKAEYTPVRTSKQVKGWISGTEVKRYHHSTVIHNTKLRACKVIIAEVLPRSAEEKIDVVLLEPSPTSLTKPSADTPPLSNDQDAISNMDSFSSTSEWPSDHVSQHKHTNNIVWLKTIPAGGKEVVNFSYKVSWPQGQAITIEG